MSWSTLTNPSGGLSNRYGLRPDLRRYLKAPFVADLSVQVQVHFHHQQPVPGPGQTRGAAPVRSGRVAGAVEMSEVVVGWDGSGEKSGGGSVGAVRPTSPSPETKPLPFLPSPDVNSLLKCSCGDEEGAASEGRSG